MRAGGAGVGGGLGLVASRKSNGRQGGGEPSPLLEPITL